MIITCEHPWTKPSLLEDEGFHTFVNFPSKFWKENQARLELSMDLKHLISGMMRLDPVRRFTLSDIHNHPWLLSSEEDYSQNVNQSSEFEESKDDMALDIFESNKVVHYNESDDNEEMENAHTTEHQEEETLISTLT